MIDRFVKAAQPAEQMDEVLAGMNRHVQGRYLQAETLAQCSRCVSSSVSDVPHQWGHHPSRHASLIRTEVEAADDLQSPREERQHASRRLRLFPLLLVEVAITIASGVPASAGASHARIRRRAGPMRRRLAFEPPPLPIAAEVPDDSELKR